MVEAADHARYTNSRANLGLLVECSVYQFSSRSWIAGGMLCVNLAFDFVAFDGMGASLSLPGLQASRSSSMDCPSGLLVVESGE